MNAAHLTPAAIGEAVGAFKAQQAIERIAAGGAPAEVAYLRFAEIAALDGWRSETAKAYIVELAKRAAASGA